MSRREATLYEGRQFFLPVYVLVLVTTQKTYQFGFNPWCKIVTDLPFELKRERINLGYSPFSILLRAVLLVYLVWFVWRL